MVHPDDLHGVPTDWYLKVSDEFHDRFSALVEFLNEDLPETYEDIEAVHGRFLSIAGPLIEEFPLDARIAVDIWSDGGEGWPWTGREDEKHEEIPAGVYLSYLDMRSAESVEAYRESWDWMLRILEDLNELL